MQIIPSTYTVADYCAAMERQEIIVNRQYQRSDKVWPPPAKSFLIESILLGYSIPKLSLYQVTDVKTRKTRKEIVDGQQRSQTIFDFYNDQFRLSKTIEFEEAAGKSFTQLNPEQQHSFLDYPLSVDLFIAFTPDKIRETFRRINSYTVPLNPEEQRHAEFQGEFKWFIYELCKDFDQNLIDLGVFTEKALVRMADAKLFSEMTHALLNGITTTNKSALYKLYKTHDQQFPNRESVRSRFGRIFEFLLSLQPIHRGSLMKPHMFYSLVLAGIHVTDPVETLSGVFTPADDYRYDRDIVLSNLTGLAEAVDNSENNSEFEEFVAASAEETNTAESRKTRFRWFCKAFQPQLM